MLARSGDLAITRDHQSLGDQRSDVVGGLAGAWNVESLERGMIAHHVRRFAVSDLPYDLAPIEIDGRDGSIGRLDEGQAIDVQSAVNSAPAASGSRLAVPCWQRRIGAGIFARTGPHLDFLSGGSS